MTARPQPGDRPFCGREEQLDALLSCWQEVRGGLGGPRTVVLLAESGLGKTRLAQQFYARLVALEQDETGYWPPRLGTEGNNLLVNPAASGFDGEVAMPFLWWGMRLADPQGHNNVTTGALAAHVDDYLVPHLAAFHKEQRRRQRLLQLAKVGGAVAADAMLDLVPFLGLLKKVGEVGVELKGIHDEWRQDRRTLDAAALLQQRRDSLVDQLLADFDKLFTGPAGRRVPAVILVDDAQFSAFDPGVTAFLAALIPAMTAGRWPVLLLVTHWEKEFLAALDPDADAGSPVAGIIDEHSRQELDAVRVVRLTPIEGLEPLVTARLPGLPADQVRRLVERAGGNPQFLEELLRVALDARSRALFEGRSAAGALTAQGLDTLLSKSVNLHDLVAERYANSPEPVQKAVALAGLQGSTFLRTLVADAAAALEQGAVAAADVGSALAEAETPHAYVASLGEDQAAFSQRIYQDVARDFLPAFYDEAEALSALRGAVADVMLGRRSLELDREASTALMRLGAALYSESPDVEERRIAAHSLHLLSSRFHATGELQVAHVTARRQAALLDTLPDDRLDGDLAWLRAVNDTLAAVGDLAAQRPVLERLVRLTGATFDDDVNTWSASMYAQALMDVADFHESLGDQEPRADALATAAGVMASLDGFEEDLEALETALRLHGLYGDLFVEAGEFERAVEVQRWALDAARRLIEVDDGPRRRFELALVQRQVGRSALLKGDAAAASADLAEAAATLRELSARDASVSTEIQLISTLDDLADAHIQADDLAAAEPLLVEGLQTMRRHLTLAPEASRTRNNLADALERLAEVRRLLADPGAAWELLREAVTLRRSVLDQLGTGRAAADLGFSLARAAAAAAAARGSAAHDDGHALAHEGLELLREAWAHDRGVRSAWRLLYGVKVALPFALARSGLAATRALLYEADVVHAELPPEAQARVGDQMSDIERLRAFVLESDGDILGAARATDVANGLRHATGAADAAGDDAGHGPN